MPSIDPGLLSILDSCPCCSPTLTYSSSYYPSIFILNTPNIIEIHSSQKSDFDELLNPFLEFLTSCTSCH